MASNRILILELVILGVLLSVMQKAEGAEGDASSPAMPAQSQSTTTQPLESTRSIKYDFKVLMKLHYYCIRLCRVLIKETRQECLERKEASCSALKDYSYKQFFAYQFNRIGLGKVASIVLRVPKGSIDTSVQVTETAATSSKKNLPAGAKPSAETLKDVKKWAQADAAATKIAKDVAKEGAATTPAKDSAASEVPVGGIKGDVGKWAQVGAAASKTSAAAASEVAVAVGEEKKDATATHATDLAVAGSAGTAEPEPAIKPALQRSTSISSDT